MSDFRSDTVTRPTADMKAEMAAAELGDDVFGDDPTVNRLQAEAAELLGFEAALFASSGTQSNLMALMSQCGRGDEVIVGQSAHTYRWEAGGMAVLGSIQPQPIEHDADGSLPLHKVRAAIKPDDPHFARTVLLALENTIGGRVLPPAYLADAKALAKGAGLLLHLDGARLFNAAAATAGGGTTLAVATTVVAGGAIAGGRQGSCDVSRQVRNQVGAHLFPGSVGLAERAAPGHAAVVAAAREICAGFDTVSVCLSKGLGCPVGSLLLGPGATIDRARRIRKLLGGAMRQVGGLAAAGRHALSHHLARLDDDHRLARRLAAGIEGIAVENPALRDRVAVERPQTNMVFVEIAEEIGPVVTRHLEAAGIRLTGGLYGGAYRQRWVTHLDVGDDDVDRALDAWRTIRMPAG
jgi:threonine aldolase